MSVLEKIEAALANLEFSFGKGKYPDTPDDSGKIVFSGEDKPVHFFGGKTANVETFRVFVRSNNYDALEQMVNAARDALQNAGFIQIGGVEDVEAKEDETFLQLAINFKSIN